jgi:hypothetical protein
VLSDSLGCGGIVPTNTGCVLLLHLRVADTPSCVKFVAFQVTFDFQLHHASCCNTSPITVCVRSITLYGWMKHN